MQKQLAELSALPSSAELYERVKEERRAEKTEKTEKTEGTGGKAEKKASKRHVTDMWQQMQLRKEVDGNKAGVEKVRPQ